MKIAINTRFLLKDYLEGYGYFEYEVLRRIVRDQSEHDFLFIFDRPYDQKFIFGKNVTAIVAGPPARHPLLWKWWYDIKIPLVLKRFKADVFVSCDGFCSLTTRVPQCLVVHDLAFLHYPSFISRSHLLFYKRYTPFFLKKAAAIATVSEFSKKDIIDHYKIPADKIDVVYNGSKDIFQRLPVEVRAQTREKYTDGRNYFVYAGAIHPRKNLVNLLKAFSVFKKRQKSNWKLVFVVITGYVPDEELAKIIGSAYAMVYPSFWEGFGVPVLEAMCSQIPVITSRNTSMEEIAGDAALYADPADHADIADKMMLVYKDETLADKLVAKGEAIARQFAWNRTADLLWTSIMKSVGHK
jgi:glycosyltransferase involved in cell wall biosynthesis